MRQPFAALDSTHPLHPPHLTPATPAADPLPTPVPHAQGEELSAAYASADMFVMPSESETLGFVVLEAMASQLPVVAVRAGGIPDILSGDGMSSLSFS